MIIRTNIGTDTIHNLLDFDPIEAQVQKYLFMEILDTVKFQIQYKTKYFVSDFFRIELVDRKKATLKARFEIKTKKDSNHWIGDEFTCCMQYNTDESKKFKKFCNKINETSSLVKEAQKLQNEFEQLDEKVLVKKINLYLNDQIKIDGYECYVPELNNIFSSQPGLEFYIKPIGKHTGEGEYYLIPIKKTGFIQASLYNRSLFRSKTYTNDIPGTKQKLKDMEDLQDAMSFFKSDGCPELLQVLEFMEKGYEMYLEIEKTTSKK